MQLTHGVDRLHGIEVERVSVHDMKLENLLKYSLKLSLAEKGGFEPPCGFTHNTLSKRAVSTAHPPLQ